VSKEQLDADGWLKVEYDRTRALYRQAVGAALVTLASSAGLLITAADATQFEYQLVWAGVMLMLLLFRVGLAAKYRRSHVTLQSAQRWNTIYVTAVVMTAVHLAFWPVFTFADLPVLHRLVSSLILGAMAGGAIAVLSIRRWLALTYGTLLLLPASLLLIFLGGHLETVAGVLGLIYLGAMYFSVTATNRSVVAAFANSHVIEGLLAKAERQRVALAEANLQLESAQMDLEETNRDLERRIDERTIELQQIATHDNLTGLSNRTRLAGLAGQPIDADHEAFAVYFLDLDGFKEINDSLGHAAGDQVLWEVARRLERKATDSMSFALARWGGDEFIIIRRRTGRVEDVLEYPQALLASLREPIVRDAFTTQVDACIGVALWPEDGGTIGELIDHADMAVYTAKALGKGQICLYVEEMSEFARRNLELKHSLRDAISSRDPRIRLFYQPIFDASSRCIVSFEALCRWNHKVLGEISPNEFIALAEGTGEIVALGEWVLHQACAFAASLRRDAMPSINVNISARQLKHPQFWTQVENTLALSGLEPKRLILELTESVFALDSEGALAVMENIDRLGIQLAIDDFGSGYSSLSYLQRFQAGMLKIDRSFVHTLESGGRAIIEASLKLAHAFDMRVVAEGIENQAQLDALKLLGVDCVQGFLLGYPQSEDDARALLETTGRRD
jgi:diguanylate cyclase (GGDEF)-like protein